MKFEWNPLKYGDALGLTHGPLSGHFPGQLTSQGLDWQGKLNPGISRTALDSSNRIAPWVAAAIATFGGSAAAGAGGSGGAGEIAGAEYPGGAGGAMDMFGSQSSPTDAATVFDQPGAMTTSSSPLARIQQAQRVQGLMGMGGGRSQPYQPQTPMYDDGTDQERMRQALVQALTRGGANA